MATMTEAFIPDLVKPFLGRIAFGYGAAKGRSCLDWARRSHPDVSWDGLVLVMLCAEALHLGSYGRPITGAVYRFEGDVAISSDLASSIIVRPNPFVDENGLPDDMSVSDAVAIEEACRDLREKGLEGLQRRAQAWRHGDVADYALMVDPTRAGAEELLSDFAYFGLHLVF
jgi:hypothetical protein